jgi:REP-associated tyrosine transposase
MKYNPDSHHRRSIRLKEYDYAQPGWYFITICTQNHAILFGDIIYGNMVLNDAGKIIEKFWLKTLNLEHI